jgi:hypothetical protein
VDEDEGGWEALESQVDPERLPSEEWPTEPVTRPMGADNADDADDADDAEGNAAPPDAEFDTAFAALLRALRALPGPCAPPVGVGTFDILYASEREVVVWYAPARDGVEQREVAIPCALLRSAWSLALRGTPVDEAALRALAPGRAGAHWLLALLAQVPGMEARHELVEMGDEGGRDPEGPAQGAAEERRDPEGPAREVAGGASAGGDGPRVTLIWHGEAHSPAAEPLPASSPSHPPLTEEGA